MADIAVTVSKDSEGHVKVSFDRKALMSASVRELVEDLAISSSRKAAEEAGRRSPVRESLAGASGNKK